MTVQQLNENTFIVYIPEQNGCAPLERLRTIEQALRRSLKACLLDVVPASHSLLLEFDIESTDATQVRNTLNSLLNHALEGDNNDTPSTLLEIPVYYHSSVAPDLEYVCKATGLLEEALIEQHSSIEYPVLAVGFLPGFAYLGSLPDALQLPRRATPRTRVPKGSVAIAEQYTGIYPRETPGGWHIIGRTPLTTLQPLDHWHNSAASPSLFKVGDRVRFVAISHQAYRDAGGSFDD